MKKITIVLLFTFLVAGIGLAGESAVDISNREATQGNQNIPNAIPQAEAANQTPSAASSQVSAETNQVTEIDLRAPIEVLFKKAWDSEDIKIKKKLRAEIIKKSPNSAYGYFCRAWFEDIKGGTIEARKKNSKLAIVLYTNAIKLNQQFAEAYNHRGMCFIRLNLHQKANADFIKALSINTQLWQAYFGRGWVHAFRKEYQKAIADYTKAIEINNKSWQLYYERGTVYYKLNQTQEAVADFAQSVSIDFLYGESSLRLSLKINNQLMLEVLSKAIEINPLSAKAYYRRGYFYKNTLRQNQEAIADFTKAIELDTQYADAYYWRGITYKIAQQFQEAEEDFIKAITLKPEHAERFYILVDHSYGDKAIAILNKIIEINSQLYQVYFSRGRIYEYQNQLSEAINDLTKSIEINPNFADAYYWRGLTFIKLKKYYAAIRDFTKAISLNYTAAYASRAKAYFLLLKFQLALADANTAIKIHPTDGEGYYYRAGVYFMLDNYRKAINELTLAIKHFKSSYITDLLKIAYEFRAKAYRKLGRIAEAEADEVQAGQ